MKVFRFEFLYIKTIFYSQYSTNTMDTALIENKQFIDISSQLFLKKISIKKYNGFNFRVQKKRSHSCMKLSVKC